MNEFDATVFEYRAEKARKNCDFILNERLHGRFQKGVVRTETAGYVEFSVYRPERAGRTAAAGERLPVVFNFHGGGMVLAFYEQDGKYCQRLANAAGCAVVNVDYPVAPEFKYPKPFFASYEAVAEILKRADAYGLDPKRAFACGHSAGGYIAIDLCLIDRERQTIGFKGAILDYAPLKQTLDAAARVAPDPSKAIKPQRIEQYARWFFEDASQFDEPLASPLYADLSRLPDLLVLSAEYDSLADEEREFVRRARQAGTAVEHMMFEGCRHGFTHEELKEYDPEQAPRAWWAMAEFIKARL